MSKIGEAMSKQKEAENPNTSSGAPGDEPNVRDAETK
jgi:hypothetical protein